MKFFLKVALVIFILIGITEPVFAATMRPAKSRPVYFSEYNHIVSNSCNAIAMIPYSGDVLYECSSGESFWSDVLVPTEKSPLFMYFKNRKHEDDDDAADTAAAAAASSSYSYY
jgi:hypothetical protein